MHICIVLLNTTIKIKYNKSGAELIVFIEKSGTAITILDSNYGSNGTNIT